jgi:ankyrin repeat protein
LGIVILYEKIFQLLLTSSNHLSISLILSGDLLQSYLSYCLIEIIRRRCITTFLAQYVTFFFGSSALLWVAEHGHAATAGMALKWGANVQALTKRLTPLMVAAEEGREAVVKLLLAEDEVNLDFKDDEGWGPLQFASFNGHVEVVKPLDAEGADITVADNDGWTPLHAMGRCADRDCHPALLM